RTVNERGPGRPGRAGGRRDDERDGGDRAASRLDGEIGDLDGTEDDGDDGDGRDAGSDDGDLDELGVAGGHLVGEV
ncbi:MAG: hypothetical protein ACRDWW_01530, partial [Acidimicrobiales bacterium]